MDASARNSYLEAEVLTATPQKLQLMLIEAAIRHADYGRELLQAGDWQQASVSLIRAQGMVSELMAGLNYEGATEIVGNLSRVYLFVYHSLIEANMQGNAQKIADAVRVLEVERETWRQVCLQISSQSASPLASATPAASVPPPHAPLPPVTESVEQWSAGGFSIDA